VDLGEAGDFVILAKTGVSTTGTTAIVGNIGVSPAAATYITGFGLILDATNQFSTSSLVTGNVYAADYSAPTPSDMTTAIADMQTAYTDAAGRTLPDYTELGAGNIGGMTLAPGLYKWGTGVTIPTDVTLSGNSTDVWIFQIAGTLTTSTGTQVILADGALPSNIFWQVAGQTTLGTYSTFKGTILDQTAIVENTGATLVGRALAQSAVTLDSNSVSLDAADPSMSIGTISNATSSNVTFTVIANGTGTAVRYVSLNIYDNATPSNLVRSSVYNASSGLNTANCTVQNVTNVTCTVNPFIGGGDFLLNVTTTDAAGLTGSSVQYFSLNTTIGNSSDINTTLTNVEVTVDGVNETAGMPVSGAYYVNVTSEGLPVLSFNYNFTASPLNFSALNISNGNRSGAYYQVVWGVNSTGGQVGTRTFYLYNVSTGYNGICVQNIENASIPSAGCNGANEFSVTCNGATDSNGVSCFKSDSDTTLTIFGLQHSGVIQYTVPAASTSQSSGSGYGGAVASGTQSSTTQSLYSVDVGNGRTCVVSIAREISSSTSFSTVTTTLKNPGSYDCTMSDFAFTDTIPTGFAAIADITFNPAYARTVGRNATFEFSSFSSGETKTLVYSVNKRVSPSVLDAFSTYSMAGNVQAAVSTPSPVISPTPVTQTPTAKPTVSPTASPTPVIAQGLAVAGTAGGVTDVILFVLAIALLGAGYWYLIRKKSKKHSVD
jgi:hypothetical protein